MNVRIFTYGIMTGIAVFVGTLLAVSQVAGVRWEPVKIDGR